MAKFEFEGKSYDSEDLSESQKQLIKTLSFTKDLNEEIDHKRNALLKIRDIFEKVWENEFESKIIDFYQKKKDTQIILENGKKLSLSKLSEKAVSCFKKLLFLNEQILYYGNQLEVLDTAKITYSRSIYESLKVTE